MAIEVKHKFVSQKADGADASLIRPSNWNDTHEITLAASRLIGRAATSAGAAQEVSVGSGLAFSGTELGLGSNTAVRADTAQTLSSAQKTQARLNVGIWTGTLAQYNAITTKDANTLYFIT